MDFTTESVSEASHYPQYGAPQFITTGEVITAEPGFLTGHGTMVTEEKKLVATVSGFVERTNKLISVRALNTRYTGEVGDVVVARVTEIGDKRWKVDVGGRQDATLMLSAVNLPGGVQRRRTHEDSLQMRSFFAENDLISAEVQKIMQDSGSIALHTRNLKYGKLEDGQFISVPPSLIKRSKQHFMSLSCGVDVILGMNGYVWISASAVAPSNGQAPATAQSKTEAELAPVQRPTDADSRERVCRIRNSILALSKMHIAIYKETILDVYLESSQLGLPAKAILNPDVMQQVTQSALQRKALQ